MYMNPNSDSSSVALVQPSGAFAGFEAAGFWEAPREAAHQRLAAPSSKARNKRGALGISQFVSIARKIWPIANSGNGV